MIGIQQQKSVITMKTSLLAIADSFLKFVDRAARAARFTVQNIAVYAMRINVKEMKLRQTKIVTEYSQPAGVPSES